MSKTPPEDEPTNSSKNPDDSSKPESDQPPSPDLPPIPEAVREASLKKKDSPAPDNEQTASPVVEAEVITESTNPPTGSYTIIGGDGDEYGPASIEDVARWIHTDRANERSLVRTEEAAQWQPLGQVPELARLLTGAIPPRPGKIKAIAIMTLVGGVWSVMVALGLGWGVAASMCLACCLIPSTVYSFVTGIMMIVQGILLLGNHPHRHLQRTRLTASLQIGCLLAADIPNVILGILNHMFLGDDAVKTYQNQDKPKSK